jgi:hypothetical protein
MQTPEERLGRRIAAAVKLRGGSKPERWVPVDAIAARLGDAPPAKVQAAIRCAQKRQWIAVEGEPATSLAITADGLSMLAPKQNPFDRIFN